MRLYTEFIALLAYGLFMIANGTTYIDVPWDQMTLYLAAVSGYAGVRQFGKARVPKNEGTS